MCFNTALSQASVTPPRNPASDPLQFLYLEDHRVYWMDHSGSIFAVSPVGLHTTDKENRQDRLLYGKFKREFNSWRILSSYCQEAHESKFLWATWQLSHCLCPSSLPSTTVPRTPLASCHSPKSFQGSPGDSATSAWLFSDLPPTYACRRLSLGNTTSSQW